MESDNCTPNSKLQANKSSESMCILLAMRCSIYGE